MMATPKANIGCIDFMESKSFKIVSFAKKLVAATTVYLANASLVVTR